MALIATYLIQAEFTLMLILVKAKAITLLAELNAKDKVAEQLAKLDEKINCLEYPNIIGSKNEFQFCKSLNHS
jgi:hypothetical protein